MIVMDSYSESNNSDTNIFPEDVGFPIGGNPVTGIAVAFENTGGTLVRTSFYLKTWATTPSPTGRLFSVIYEHSGTYGTDSTIPSGTRRPLAISEPVDVSTLTSSYQLINFDFTGSNKINLSDQYYMAAVVFPCEPPYRDGFDNAYISVAVDTVTMTHEGNSRRFGLANNNILSDLVSPAGVLNDVPFYVYVEHPFQQQSPRRRVRRFFSLDSYPESNQETDNYNIYSGAYVIMGNLLILQEEDFFLAVSSILKRPVF